MCYNYVYLCNIFNQRLSFAAGDLLMEVAGETFFQVFDFTNIDNRTSGVIHTIDPRLAS